MPSTNTSGNCWRACVTRRGCPAAGLSSLVRYLAVHETAKEVTLQILGLRLHTLRSCRPRDRDKFVAGVPAPGAGAPSCQGERHAAK